MEHAELMREALLEAQLAYTGGEVPVGAVIVQDGCIVSRGRNHTDGNHDPTAHAEIIAIREACKRLGRRKLQDCALYTTIYPCPMCEMVIREAELGKVFYGGRTVRYVREVKFPKARFEPEGPVLDDECRGLFIRKLEEMGRTDILELEQDPD